MSDAQVTTNELMEFLQDHMVTKEELDVFKTEIHDEFEQAKKARNVMKLEILDSIDDKLADLKADLVLLIRKGDTKFCCSN
jgi:hypothetical protein